MLITILDGLMIVIQNRVNKIRAWTYERAHPERVKRWEERPYAD